MMIAPKRPQHTILLKPLRKMGVFFAATSNFELTARDIFLGTAQSYAHPLTANASNITTNHDLHIANSNTSGDFQQSKAKCPKHMKTG